MKTIAVVEDNADNRLIVTAMLRAHYQIVQYESGQEALDGIADAPPDAVLLDISLPGMDGLEVLEHLRADENLAGMPVIAFTAHAMSGDRERFLQAGFDDYLTKPITDDKILLQTIGRWV